MRHSQRHYSLAEYFLNEKMSPVKLEYFEGEIFVMSGGSRNHDRIAGNVTALLIAGLRGSACEPHTSDMRIMTPSGLYTHPDASVCGHADIAYIQGTETIGNPVVLVEVLSDSTRDYDRGQKFELYRAIPTLRDYLLIEQSRTQVEHRYWSDGEWLSRTVTEGTIKLTGVELELPLALVYERVSF